MQMRHEFTNHQVRDVRNRRSFNTGRRQENNKLAEIVLVASKRVWRGIAHRAQIVQELAHRGFHVPPLRQIPQFKCASCWCVPNSKQPKRLGPKSTSQIVKSKRSEER